MWKSVALVACLALLVVVGCSPENSDEKASSSSATPTIDGAQYLLTAEPIGALDVIKLREEAQDQDDVVVVGRIGGSESPWIDGRAAFSIVDNSLKPCNEIPGDNCPKPWDYCCETSTLPEATALIKVVDQDGMLVKADAKTLLKVQELSTVVVKGKAQRDDAGNLTVLASGVYVKKM